jgi:hypothetical protein
MFSVDGGPWPRGWKFDLAHAQLDNGPSPAGNEGPYLHAQRVGADTFHRLYPLVQSGDRVWGRETWMPFIDAGGGPFRYAADYDAEGKAGMSELQRWRSPIFMPRRAARLVREVVGRRVERLQAINEADAVAEGVSSSLMRAGGEEKRLWQADAAGHVFCDTARQAFGCRWDELHAQGPADDLPASLVSWKGDPWVLVLTYGRAELSDG